MVRRNEQSLSEPTVEDLRKFSHFSSLSPLNCPTTTTSDHAQEKNMETSGTNGTACPLISSNDSYDASFDEAEQKPQTLIRNNQSSSVEENYINGTGSASKQVSGTIAEILSNFETRMVQPDRQNLTEEMFPIALNISTNQSYVGHPNATTQPSRNGNTNLSGAKLIYENDPVKRQKDHGNCVLELTKSPQSATRTNSREYDFSRTNTSMIIGDMTEYEKSNEHHCEKATNSSEHYREEATNGDKHNSEEATNSNEHHCEEATNSNEHHCEEATLSNEHHCEEATNSNEHHREEPTKSNEHCEEPTKSNERHCEDPTNSNEHHCEEPTNSSEHHCEEPTNRNEHHCEEPTNSNEHCEEPTNSNEHHCEEPAKSNEHHCEEPAKSNEQYCEEPAKSNEHHREEPTKSNERHCEEPTKNKGQHITTPCTKCFPSSDIEVITCRRLEPTESKPSFYVNLKNINFSSERLKGYIETLSKIEKDNNEDTSTMEKALETQLAESTEVNTNSVNRVEKVEADSETVLRGMTYFRPPLYKPGLKEPPECRRKLDFSSMARIGTRQSIERNTASPARIGHTSKPRVSTPIGHTDKPRVSTPIGHTSKPRVSTPIGHTDKPRVSTPIGHTDKPRVSTSIGHTDKLLVSTSIGHTDKPRVSTSIGHTDKLLVSTPIGHTDKPRVSTSIGHTDKLLVSTPIGHTDKPHVSTPIDHTDKPHVSTPFGHTNKPRVSTPIDHTDKPRVGTPIGQTDKIQMNTPIGHTDKPRVSTPIGHTDKIHISTPIGYNNEPFVSTPTDHTDRSCESTPFSHTDKSRGISPVGYTDKLHRTTPVSHTYKSLVTTPVLPAAKFDDWTRQPCDNKRELAETLSKNCFEEDMDDICETSDEKVNCQDSVVDDPVFWKTLHLDNVRLMYVLRSVPSIHLLEKTGLYIKNLTVRSLSQKADFQVKEFVKHVPFFCHNIKDLTVDFPDLHERSLGQIALGNKFKKLTVLRMFAKSFRSLINCLEPLTDLKELEIHLGDEIETDLEKENIGELISALCHFLRKNRSLETLKFFFIINTEMVRSILENCHNLRHLELHVQQPMKYLQYSAFNLCHRNLQVLVLHGKERFMTNIWLKTFQSSFPCLRKLHLTGLCRGINPRLAILNTHPCYMYVL